MSRGVDAASMDLQTRGMTRGRGASGGGAVAAPDPPREGEEGDERGGEQEALVEAAGDEEAEHRERASGSSRRRVPGSVPRDHAIGGRVLEGARRRGLRDLVVVEVGAGAQGGEGVADLLRRVVEGRREPRDPVGFELLVARRPPVAAAFEVRTDIAAPWRSRERVAVLPSASVRVQVRAVIAVSDGAGRASAVNRPGVGSPSVMQYNPVDATDSRGTDDARRSCRSRAQRGAA